MMHHHADESLLLEYAAGNLNPAAALVVQAHLETCTTCRASVEALEQVGGILLEDQPPVPMQADAFQRTLDRALGSEMAQQPSRSANARQVPAQTARPELPAGMRWPRSLEHCSISPWKRIGPGMRWSRISVPTQPDANMFLLRMGAGMELAAHTHSGRELTQVLYGSFQDEGGRWSAGDLEDANHATHHRPVVGSESECICLVAVDGRVQFDGWLASALGAWMGI